MSLPKCFSVLNTAWFSNLTLQIQGVTTAAELQSLINEAYAELGVLESTIQSQLNFIGPIEQLLTAPTADLGKIVTWITSFITDFLTPYVQPFLVLPEQITAITSQVAALESAIQQVASAKFPGASITIPSITIGCTL